MLPVEAENTIRDGWGWRTIRSKDGTAFRPTIDLHPLAGTEITRVGKNPLQGVHFNSDLIAVMDDSDVVRLALATLAECYLIAAGSTRPTPTANAKRTNSPTNGPPRALPF